MGRLNKNPNVRCNIGVAVKQCCFEIISTSFLELSGPKHESGQYFHRQDWRQDLIPTYLYDLFLMVSFYVKKVGW